MNETRLILPTREVKPREEGLTVVIDNGAPLNLFRDAVRSSSDYVDLVKFGWGTSLVTKFLQQKMDYLQEHGIDFFFGGTFRFAF